MLIRKGGLLKSSLAELNAEVAKLFMTFRTFWDVDGMWSDHCGNDVVTRGRKHYGAFLFLDGEHVVYRSPLALKVLSAMTFSLETSEIGLLLLNQLFAQPGSGSGLPRLSACQGSAW